MKIVALQKCPDYDEERVNEALVKVLEHLGGLAHFVRKGMKVVIKPNLLMKRCPEEAVTTHPALVRALVRMINEAGGMVTLAESPGGPYTEGMLRAVYSATGMEKVACEEGMTLNYDLSCVDVENPGGKYLQKVSLLKPLVEAELLINLPKMKSHEQMVYTGAVKNMFGSIAGIYKAECHLRMPDHLHFADLLIDIFLAAKPHLTIMDAVVAMDGPGPASGNPRNVGLLIASEDAFALDVTALAVAGVEGMSIPVIRQAFERGLTTALADEIEIVGESLEEVKDSGFMFPALQSPHDIHWAAKGIVRRLLHMLKPSPHFNHALCVGCGECARACPAKIIEMRKKKPSADLKKCIRCFCCQELCPEKAVTVKRPLLARLLLK
jgi:uncharacterized protein (DUF362 family)/Pyruvate/2-oxoacid:ferredoxin oxidoreductase delta subunit